MAISIEQAINSEDMEAVFDSMTAYVAKRLEMLDIKNLEGKEPEDFVSEVFLKILTYERDWAKANCTFKQFLFGCLKSHIYSFLKGLKNQFADNLPDDVVDENYDVVEIKEIAILNLIDNGCDKYEIEIFECWCDGYTKPSDISKVLNKDVKEIYNVQKRLLRKLPQLQMKLKNIL